MLGSDKFSQVVVSFSLYVNEGKGALGWNNLHVVAVSSQSLE